MNGSVVRHVVVVGATSQIGYALMPRLEAQGLQVSRVGRTTSDGTSGATHSFDPVRQRFEPPLGTADAVISLAPLPAIGAVLEMADALGARRVLAFGSTGRFSKRGSASVLERDFVAQQEQAELLFSTRSEASGIAWTLFRPTMIYGAGSDQNVAVIRRLIRRFGFFPLPRGARGLRQPVHVGDLASACLSTLDNQRTFNRAYDLGGGESLSFPEMVRRLFAAEGKTPRLLPVPRSLYSLLIGAAKSRVGAGFVREEMIGRMFSDLTVSNCAAVVDFGYSPRKFMPEPLATGCAA